ncbi:MAG: AsmA-like C-terminal region-containing protein [Phycisphaerales bacterium]|nr:AsmA-like C-terminal region-containing protein [Phycisphaerales bacterium]
MNQTLRTWLWSQGSSHRPASYWRRGLGIVLLGLLITGGIAYHTLTEEARLRGYAEHWLTRFTGGQVKVEQVSLSLFRGLSLVGVTVALPPGTGFDPHDDSLEGRTLFRSSTVFLHLRPLSLLTGRLVVPEVVAINPELTLVHRISDGLGNWELMLGQRAETETVGKTRLPVIRLRNVRFRHVRLDEFGRSGGIPEPIWADAQPLADRPAVYDVKITRFISTAEAGEMTGRFQIDMNTLACFGSLPILSLDEAFFPASPEIHRWFKVLNLRGYVRPDAIQFDPESGAKVTLSLRGAGLSLPLDEMEEARSHDRYVQLSDLAGSLQFDGRTARIDIAGRFRQCPIQLKGELFLAAGQAMGLDAMGFDLEIKVETVPMPRDDENADPAEFRFVQRWARLKKMVEKYDIIGPVDLALRLRKEPGPGEGVEIVSGTLAARGASASYSQFPYRVHNLSGAVQFLPDGRIQLDRISGDHGKGRVEVNGWVEGWSSAAACQLDITGTNIHLADDLLNCLSESNQELCRLFNIQGRINLGIRMERAAAHTDDDEEPWRTAVDVQFLDGSLKFAAFPYALDRLAGRMRIEEGRFRIDQLTARHGSAVIRAHGTARHIEGHPTELDLYLDAKGVVLDGALVDALPSDVADLYARFDPAGVIGINGRVFTVPGDMAIRYELALALDGVEWGLPDGEARIARTAGTVRVLPDRLEIESVTGRFRDAYLAFAGWLSMRDSSFNLQVRCDRLPLDQSLYDTLPLGVRAMWDMFDPHGTVALDLRYTREGASTQQAEEPMFDYEAVIEPRDTQVTYSGFPIPLTQLNGRLTVRPGQVVIEHLEARHEGCAIRFDGQIGWSREQTEVELSLQAQGLAFAESLRQAVPWRIRRLWNDLRPQGLIDIDLDRFSITLRPEQPVDVFVGGSIALRDCGFSLGLELTDINGWLSGHMAWGAQSEITADLALSGMRVDGRELTDASARLKREVGSALLSVQQILGQLYDGTVVGQAEVDFSADVPKYGLSMSCRDMSLQQFLNAKLAADEQPIEIKGQVEGTLSLTGRLGDQRSRRGGGSIFINEAQMFKVPMMLTILQVIHLATDDDNAFHDAAVKYVIDGEDLVIEEIDLRGKSFSMIGAGRVRIPTLALNLTLLIGSPLELPRLAVLSELVEGIARELVEVHIHGTLDKPVFRTEIIRSLKQALETLLNARRPAEMFPSPP